MRYLEAVLIRGVWRGMKGAEPTACRRCLWMFLSVLIIWGCQLSSSQHFLSLCLVQLCSAPIFLSSHSFILIFLQARCFVKTFLLRLKVLIHSWPMLSYYLISLPFLRLSYKKSVLSWSSSPKHLYGIQGRVNANNVRDPHSQVRHCRCMFSWSSTRRRHQVVKNQ